MTAEPAPQPTEVVCPLCKVAVPIDRSYRIGHHPGLGKFTCPGSGLFATTRAFQLTLRIFGGGIFGRRD